MAQQHATHLHLAADGQGEGERGRWPLENENGAPISDCRNTYIINRGLSDADADMQGKDIPCVKPMDSDDFPTRRSI